jgi:hypothetical protein
MAALATRMVAFAIGVATLAGVQANDIREFIEFVSASFIFNLFLDSLPLASCLNKLLL